MIRFRSMAVGLLLLSLAAAGRLPAQESAPLQLVLAAGSKVERWSLDVRFDGTPVAHLRRRALQQMLDFYDVDRDGQLGEQEASALPTPFGMRQLTTGRVLPAATRPPASVDQNQDGRLSLDELAVYYGDGTGCLVAGCQSPATDALNAALLRAFSLAEGDVLDPPKLNAAASGLLRLDANGDELVSAGELVPGVKYPGAHAATMRSGQTPAADAPWLLFPPADDGLAWRQNWQARLDHDGDQRLASTELQPQGEDFTALDRDHDGDLDEAELAAWRSTPPPRRLQAKLWGQGALLSSDAEPGSPATTTLWISTATHAVRAHGVWLDHAVSREKLAALAAQLRDLAEPNAQATPLAAIQDIPNRVELLRFAALADANRDEQTTFAEADACVAYLAAWLRSQAVLSIVDLQASLFACLDQNFDGSLSAAELTSSEKRLAEGGFVKEGRFTLQAAPRQLRLVLSNGVPDQLLDGGLRTGPAWFQAMDRNGDGALTHGEFLAGDAEFQSLDKNGDGRIVLEELTD
ncbi:hypothetical protein [Lignipirellula cremea]|uniref:Transaldolase/EF-hand domain-containing protein n=1 Tax=Lignipirellula cremea TaxID=2528010 RepID=A0A518E4R9_9BACT|nr:hypothetical protein [Lignipirellula cremea]QDU99074.1 transaldolase/EF-hand domain-containing protein [Lignipirellula cremea]